MTRIPHKPAPTTAARPEPARRYDVLIYVLLFLTTLAVYGQVRGFDFVNYDDREYIVDNARVRAGLTWEGAVWAFTTSYGGNWFPLTWLSHMLDFRMFGPDSGLHHLMNVLIHALGSLLLFALLRRMTGCRWRSAFVAALFALHPLHVESVAWVTERKDVLSGFFWFLTIWLYLRYVERPRLSRYLFMVASFILGLMSKSMVVTLPFALLLLDYWPLRRFALWDASSAKKPGRPAVLMEKAPLLALSLAVSVVTFLVQRGGGAVAPIEYVPLGARLANGLVSYVTYLRQLFAPVRLSAFYPLPVQTPVWLALVAALTLAAVSLLVVKSLRRRPYLAVGWFWYLGTLVPVIGLVQVGMQAHADRYAYLPSVGILMMLAWGVPELLGRMRSARAVLTGLSVAFCSICILLTWFQIRHWQNSASLFRHALAVTSDNHVAHNGLGIALLEEGHIEEAISHYQEAIRLKPRYPEARANLGQVQLKMGRVDEAVEQLREAIRLSPSHPEARINLAIAYDAQGKPEEAATQLLEALRLDPDSPNAHYNLGRVYAELGKMVEAQAQFYEVIRLEPESAEAHYNLGVILARRDNPKAAIPEFLKALQINPDYASAHNNLGSILANLGQIDEAIFHFREAVRINPESEEMRYNLEYALSLKK